MTSEATIVGNLTSDAEIKYGTSGPVATFSVAVNRSWKDKSGEWTEQVSYFDCIAFGQLAENFAASATKGNRVVVCGRLQQSQYTANDGTTKQRVQLVANDIGASLKFARCEIERVERTNTQTSSGQFAKSLDAEDPF